MYIALNYIGNRYTPGEIIGDDLPEETIKRLIEKGAVKAEPDAEPQMKPQEEPTHEENLSAADDDEAAIEPPEIDATEALVTAPKKRGRGGKT